MTPSGGATLIIVPVLGRPHRVAPLLASIANGTPEPHRVLFMATAGDGDELDAIVSAGADHMVIAPNHRGDYQKKINHAYRSTREPWLFLAADDLEFHPGWLSSALALMADESIGVVGTNDLGNQRTIDGTHATHSLVRRSYIDRFGAIDQPGIILHEGYPHEWCDDEFVQTAQHRGAYAHAHDSIVEHLHPLWGKADTDELYDAHAARMKLGRKIFWRRSPLWR